MTVLRSPGPPSTIVLFNDVLCGRRVRAEFIKTSNGDNNDDADDDDEAA